MGCSKTPTTSTPGVGRAPDGGVSVLLYDMMAIAGPAVLARFALRDANA
jgi:hypothetical protein